MAIEILAERQDCAHGTVIRVFTAGDMKIRWTHTRLYGEADHYVTVGSKADLMAAGVCNETEFPQLPKRVMSGNGAGKHEYWSVRRLRGGMFQAVHGNVTGAKANSYRRLITSTEGNVGSLARAASDEAFQRMLIAQGWKPDPQQ